MARGSRRGSPVERAAPAPPVPLRDRVAAALESGVRDGRWGPGDALPAARQLARRLGVHRHTVGAAYRRLAERGLVVRAPGHPPRVAPFGSPRVVGAGSPRVMPAPASRGGAPARRVTASEEPARSIARGLASARLRGFAREDALQALREGLALVRHPFVTLYEPRPGLRAALAAELAEALGVPLHAARAPAPTGPPRPGAALLRAELWPRLAARLPEVERIPIRLAGGGRERERILRELPRPCVVGLLTRSRTVRAFATELAASAYGRGVSLAAPDPDDLGAVERAARVAALFLVDASCAAAVPPTRATVRRLRLVAEPDAAALRRYFGARGRPGGPRGEPAG